MNFLRFIAALSIIVYHITPELRNGATSPIGYGVHNLLIGVDLFFLISGFLITFLLIKEKQRYANVSLINFYMRRVLRIFPLYYLIVIFSYFAFFEAKPETDFMSHFFFLGNFSLISHSSWTITSLNPLWSICIEEHFYLVVPLVIYLLPVRKLVPFFITIVIISMMYRISVVTMDGYRGWMNIYAHTLSRCDVIAIGGLIAVMYNYYPKMFQWNKFVLVIALLLFTYVMIAIGYSDYSSIYNVTIKKYIFVSLLVIIFIAIVLSDLGSPLWNAVRENRVVDYLGKISYGLYMYHSIVYWYLSKIAILHDSILIRVVSVTLISIVISSISYECYEKLFLKFKWRFSRVASNSSRYFPPFVSA